MWRDDTAIIWSALNSGLFRSFDADVKSYRPLLSTTSISNRDSRPCESKTESDGGFEETVVFSRGDYQH